jgi:hypothetical protein
MNIIQDNNEYKKYYNKPKNIKKYDEGKLQKLIALYYFPNYAFPNVNPMFHNENKKAYWVKKIKKMYYSNEGIGLQSDYDKYWYSLIKPDKEKS